MLEGIYAITGDRGGDPRLLSARIRSAWDGGACAVQIREKSTSRDGLRNLASLLLGPRSGKLILNGDLVPLWPWDLLVPDGLHLGAGNGTRARQWLERNRDGLGLPDLPWIWSAHSAEEAAQAVARGAAAVTISPIFETESHPGALPAGLPLLQATVARCPGTSVIALGGVGPGRLAACFHGGASAVAMIGAVFGNPDPGGAVRALCSEWEAARQSPSGG